MLVVDVELEPLAFVLVVSRSREADAVADELLFRFVESLAAAAPVAAKEFTLLADEVEFALDRVDCCAVCGGG